MKGVVLAGGTGSRLLPLTQATPKHLLPVGTKPMILHPIHKLVEAGMEDILVVTGAEPMGDMARLLGSGSEHRCHLTYKVQEQAGGIAQALGLAKDFAQGGSLCVILGDNIFQDPLAPFVENFSQQAQGARVFLKEVPDPQRYGVAEMAGDQIVSIEEKPQRPKSAYCVTGIYMYDAQVFEIIPRLAPSQRGELEITAVNNHYLQQSQLCHDILPGWWTDAGTFASYSLANQRVAQEIQ